VTYWIESAQGFVRDVIRDNVNMLIDCHFTMTFVAD